MSLSSTDLGNLLRLSLALPNYRTREKFEEYIREAASRELRGKIEGFAIHLERLVEFNLEIERDQRKYVDDVLTGRELLTFKFLRQINGFTGADIFGFFPFDEGLENERYIEVYCRLNKDAAVPTDVRGLLALQFYMTALPDG